MRILKNLGLSACTTFLFLVLMEILLRVFAPQIMQRCEGLYVPDEKTVFALAPNFRGSQVGRNFNVAIETNSKGLRDRDFSYKKSSRVFRILVLGDSWTFGSGVEGGKTYPKVLEKLLNQKYPEKEWEVVNSGVSAYGTFNELAFLKKEGVKYSPDLIILGFFPVNDIFDNASPYRFKVNENGELISRKSKQGFFYRIKVFIRLHSHLFRFAGDRYHLFLYYTGLEKPERDSCEIFKTSYSDPIRKAWKKTENLILQIWEIAKSNDSKFLIVNIPRLYQVYPHHWSKFVKMYQQNSISLDSEKPSKHLNAFGKRHGILVLDLIPLLKKHSFPESLYLLPANGHWSADGHAVTAEYILEKIIIEGIAPK